MYSLGELARWIGGEVVGDPDRQIRGLGALGTAGVEEIAPYTDPRYRDQLASSQAGALLVASPQDGLGVDQLVAPDPGWALVVLLQRFYPGRAEVAGVHPSAVVDPASTVDGTASIGAFVSIGAGSTIGSGVVLHPGVVVGPNCQVGEGTVLHPRVVLYADTVVGKHVIVHAGAVLGSDGFGYVQHDGQLVKVPQVGRLVIEDGVEIGANTTIDRATLDETRIGASSKLDNLVQVGHNVRVGAGCILCGQVGIAGSTTLGHGVVMGGKAGAADHLEIGDGVQVAGASAVLQSVAAGTKVGGQPALELSIWRRAALLMPRLPELFRRLRKVERRLDNERGSEEISE